LEALSEITFFILKIITSHFGKIFNKIQNRSVFYVQGGSNMTGTDLCV